MTVLKIIKYTMYLSKIYWMKVRVIEFNKFPGAYKWWTEGWVEQILVGTSLKLKRFVEKNYNILLMQICI